MGRLYGPPDQQLVDYKIRRAERMEGPEDREGREMPSADRGMALAFMDA